MTIKNAEQIRLDEAREKNIPWKKWGPYLSEQQWGTVREDYSAPVMHLFASCEAQKILQ